MVLGGVKSTKEDLVTVHEDAGVRKRSDGLFEKDDRRQSDGKLV